MRNTLTIEAFAAWCETKPADDVYDYWSFETCGCAQYAKAFGLPYYKGIVDESPFWRTAEDCARSGPYTFGALAARLRASA